jgi:hypothetical protein
MIERRKSGDPIAFDHTNCGKLGQSFSVLLTGPRAAYSSSVSFTQSEGAPCGDRFGSDW